MKRILISAVAAIALSASFAPLAIAQPNYQGQQAQQGPQHQDQASQGGDVHRDHRHAWRDTRANAQWDDSQHNGYYDNNRWHFGPPPANYQGRQGFALGYHPWARGQRLGYYNARYTEVDYRTAHLRQPSRGYHWVRDDQGDYLLAAVASGIIASVILNSDR
ncbi:MAG: RcnB family protein [Pseudomonadota bacterium]